MATLNWIPPLPPGYEARWDMKQKAYFYINHTTKQTSWTDPRPKYYAKVPKDHPPPNPKPASGGDPVFGFRGSGNFPKKEDGMTHDFIKLQALKENFPDVSDEILRIVLKTKNNNVAETRNHLIKTGYKCVNEVDHSSAGQLQIDLIVKKLQKSYPLARYDIIRDIVAGCNNNEANAKKQLEGMGYKPVASTSTARPKSQSRSRSPSPVPKKIPEAEKKKILLRMMGDFHDLGEDFIKMGLESVNYDDAKFRRLVEHYKQDKSHKPKSGSATGRKKVDDEVTFKPTESLVPASFSGGMEPVVFGHDLDDFSSSPVPFSSGHSTPKKTTSTKTQQTRQTSTSHKTPTKQTVRTTQPRQRSPAHGQPRKETIDQHAARLRAHQNQPNRAKQVTHVSHTTGVVQSQPRSSLAKGPDPSIRKGPDRTLLLTDYVAAAGPNPDHYHGPDSSRVHGSQGAYGRDPSLVCGPQAVNSHSYRDNLLISAV